MAALKDAHVYLPPDVYRAIKAAADAARRSLSAEIVYRLEQSVKNGARKT